jgi:phosphoribosylformylglycinamidine (FGAM) synthase-like enzyme
LLRRPFRRRKQAIAEAYRNLCAVGATPLAVTNCLNFGSPQRPEIMAQIVGCLDGMSEACRALDFPIVSGNVSLYNESKATGGGSAILPTPAIGGVGLIEDHTRMATIGFKAPGETIFIIGEGIGHIGQSLWLREIAGREEGAPPPVDLARERRHATLIRELIEDGDVTAVHDIADGGAAVALAEMALAGNLGCRVTNAYDNVHEWFAEDQARYLVTTRDPARLRRILDHRQLYGGPLGVTGGTSIVFDGELLGVRGELSLVELRAAHERFFTEWMEA